MGLIGFVAAHIELIIAAVGLVWLAWFLWSLLDNLVLRAELDSQFREIGKPLGWKPGDHGTAELLARIRHELEQRRHLLVGGVVALLGYAKRDLRRAKRIERRWEATRTLVEVFPLLGILGTVSAMAQAAPGDAEDVAAALQRSVALLGTAIDSTVYGLLCAIVSLALIALFSRRIEQNLADVRELHQIVFSAEHVVERGLAGEEVAGDADVEPSA